MTYDTLETLPGVDIAYTDSGAPSQSQYTTIIAIHGSSFCAPIFKRTQAAALKMGVRFVAVIRRIYPGSTPLTPEEIDALNQGTEDEKGNYLKNRGNEFANFIHVFINKNEIPCISEDGKSGGVVLLGWSMGCGEAIATIAHADTIPPDIRARLSSYIRALVLYEAGHRHLGLPVPPKDWNPFLVSSYPIESRGQAFAQWVSAYFDHGDLSTRDPDVLSYILPSTSRPGSMYNMTKSEQEEIILLGPETALEGAYLLRFCEQQNAAYRRVFFGDLTELFPRIKISHLAGDKSPSFAIAGHWAIQKDAEEVGNSSIHFKLVPGMNHFVHWDEPEKAIHIFLECAGVEN